MSFAAFFREFALVGTCRKPGAMSSSKRAVRAAKRVCSSSLEGIRTQEEV